MKLDYSNIHRDIIEQSIAGNNLAQHQLYKLYSKAMFNICYRMMNDQQEAEDVLQEAFVTCFQKLHTFRFESSFGAWFKQLVIHKCINTLKKRKLDLNYTDEVYQLEKNIEVEEKTNENEIKYEISRVREKIEQLPEGYRLVISLYLIEGYDHKEIAGILGITESTSKSQFLRAKKKLRTLLNVA